MQPPKTKQRSFHLPAEQADWLREEAFRTRRSQTEIVREAIAERQARAAAPAAAQGEGHVEALVEMFVEGRGVDLELLRDRDAMWRREP